MFRTVNKENIILANVKVRYSTTGPTNMILRASCIYTYALMVAKIHDVMLLMMIDVMLMMTTHVTLMMMHDILIT